MPFARCRLEYGRPTCQVRFELHSHDPRRRALRPHETSGNDLLFGLMNGAFPRVANAYCTLFEDTVKNVAGEL